MIKAVIALIGYGFEYLNLHRIKAGTCLANPASSGALTKAGLSCEGTARSSLFKAGA